MIYRDRETKIHFIAYTEPTGFWYEPGPKRKKVTVTYGTESRSINKSSEVFNPKVFSYRRDYKNHITHKQSMESD